MSEPIDPHKVFEALAGSTGGKVVSKSEYHQLQPARACRSRLIELPTKWELEVIGDVVVVHIEASETAMEYLRQAAEQVGLEEIE
jgi:hypothetical protein